MTDDVPATEDARADIVPAAPLPELDIRAGVDLLPDATVVLPLEQEALASRPLVDAADLSATREPFGIGSTREEVIAVQGKPIYSQGDSSWWGSAHVHRQRTRRQQNHQDDEQVRWRFSWRSKRGYLYQSATPP